MANNPKLANIGANAAADAACALLNSGYLRIYSGTQPATADTALAGNTLLAELRFNATAFGAASAGVATANAITSDTDADASGTPSFFRALKSDGSSVVCDGSVGTSGTDAIIDVSPIVQHGTVNCTAFTYTQQKG